jgi:transcriptional regulator
MICGPDTLEYLEAALDRIEGKSKQRIDAEIKGDINVAIAAGKRVDEIIAELAAGKTGVGVKAPRMGDAGTPEADNTTE